MRQNQITALLHRLGATANYMGYFHTAYAISLSVDNPQRLLLVTKWLYPEVASHYHTTWMAVERDIRTLLSVIWKANPELLSQLAGYSLPEKPRPSQFLEILTTYLLETSVIDAGSENEQSVFNTEGASPVLSA